MGVGVSAVVCCNNGETVCLDVVDAGSSAKAIGR